MVFPDRRTLNALMTALLFGLVLAIVYVARTVIVIFAFSILFAYLINPIVRFLQSHSLFFENLRGPHVAEAYLAPLILLGLIIHDCAPQLVPGVEQLVRDSPAMLENVYLGDIAVDMGYRNGWDEAGSLRAKVFLQQRWIVCSMGIPQEHGFCWTGFAMKSTWPEGTIRLRGLRFHACGRREKRPTGNK
jgi:hypothetical protein